MKNTAYEIRYMIAAPFTLVLLVQYVALYWLEDRVPHARWWFFWLVIPFLIQNFVFQIVVGTLLFLEWPRDLQFTGRIKRMDEAGDPRAARFKRVLNESDEGHV